MAKETTQFSIEIPVKNRLDRFKANNKQKIINEFNKDKRYVTNSEAVDYLLDIAGVERRESETLDNGKQEEEQKENKEREPQGIKFEV